ncbi:hypothetical protein FS837_004257 [Tulasnella sp. UAMH 9824]|nr:hypothetical protein FS837_004257 [Tulasnella sp. UAMH 9824]
MSEMHDTPPPIIGVFQTYFGAETLLQPQVRPPVQELGLSQITPLCSYINPLSTAWARIRPKAERFVEEQARLRLEAEEDPITRSRRSTFRQAYRTFKSSYNEFPKTLVPSERSILKTHKGIAAVIEAEGTDTSPTIFDNVFNELPDYVDRWRKERKLELTRLVLETRIGPGRDIDPQTAEEQGILSLATSVFATCGRGETFTHDTDTVHWFDSIGEHSQKKIYHTPSRKSPLPYEEMQCIRVLPNLVDHVKLLVQAVGFDPNNSTAPDMDKLDARFYCDDCCVVDLRGEASARSWRNCVGHHHLITSPASDSCKLLPNFQINHIGFHSNSKPWKGWTLLSPEDRALVDRYEKSMEKGNHSAPESNISAVSLKGRRVVPGGGRGRYKVRCCYRGRVSGDGSFVPHISDKGRFSRLGVIAARIDYSDSPDRL